MEVLIDAEHRAEDVAALPVGELLRFAMRREGCPENSEVSVSFVDDEAIAALNEEWRGKKGPTDVLSFECDDPWGAVEGEEVVEVGDVVIAPDVVEAQRSKFGTSFEEEASLMLVHSILHLLGYDHLEEEEAEAMEAKEKEILDAYGLTGVR